jgi:zinc transport system substrate-binding protein
MRPVPILGQRVAVWRGTEWRGTESLGRIRRGAGLVTLLVLVAALGSCARSSNAANGKLAVVASFYPLAEAAQRVGGGLVQVTNLTAPGVEPHDLELAPSQLEAISTADVVLYLGGGFQPAVEDALPDAGGETVDLSAGLRTLPVPAGDVQASLSADPHVWLDPALYSQVVGAIERRLAKADPAHASSFASNARAFQDQLARLADEYRIGLANCERHVIVTTHAAFGYLALRYGLQQEAISGLSPDAEPSPGRLAQLKQLVERDGITTIFTESLVSPKVAETLASETGATTAVLNPLESLTSQELAGGKDYVSAMRQNLSTLRTALGCR